MMTSARFLTAMVLAACALVASVLVAIPTTDSPDTLDIDTLSPGYTATVPQLAGTMGQAAAKPTTRSLQPVDESHVALPRIWLGSPIAR